MSQPAAYQVTKWELQQKMLGRFTIRYTCPACGSILSSPVNNAGKTDSCPDCNSVFVLPVEAAKQAEAIQREREAAKAAEQRAQNQAKEEEKRRIQAEKEAERQAMERRQQQQAAAIAAERAAAAQKRQEYLNKVSFHQKKYRVILADSAEHAESICNSMGFEGWDLEQSFTDTFHYQQCCGSQSKRQFVLIFSQRLDVERSV